MHKNMQKTPRIFQFDGILNGLRPVRARWRENLKHIKTRMRTCSGSRPTRSSELGKGHMCRCRWIDSLWEHFLFRDAALISGHHWLTRFLPRQPTVTLISRCLPTLPGPSLPTDHQLHWCHCFFTLALIINCWLQIFILLSRPDSHKSEWFSRIQSVKCTMSDNYCPINTMKDYDHSAQVQSALFLVFIEILLIVYRSDLSCFVTREWHTFLEKSELTKKIITGLCSSRQFHVGVLVSFRSSFWFKAHLLFGSLSVNIVSRSTRQLFLSKKALINKQYNYLSGTKQLATSRRT